MTGINTDEVIDVEGDPGCSFCKVPRVFRAYMFCNDPQKDCFICDVCVVALAEKFASLGDPDPYNSRGRPN